MALVITFHAKAYPSYTHGKAKTAQTAQMDGDVMEALKRSPSHRRRLEEAVRAALVESIEVANCYEVEYGVCYAVE